MTQDPTREEMLEFLADDTSGFDKVDFEEAIYWFANGSNLYSALSPSPLANCPRGISRPRCMSDCGLP
jgi:hypothetical protein